MFKIYYLDMVIFISIIWCIVRLVVYKKSHLFSWKREMQLLLVYICIVVVSRFTFFPFSKVNGMIQPLIFDVSKIYPFRINMEPIIHMTDYVEKRKALLNFVGNVTMFIPIGIVYPIVFKNLNTHLKVIAAGVGFSLVIEILQLAFYERVTDIDDLLMNSAGYLIGYGIYLFVKWLNSCKNEK